MEPGPATSLPISSKKLEKFDCKGRSIGFGINLVLNGMVRKAGRSLVPAGTHMRSASHQGLSKLAGFVQDGNARKRRGT